MLSAWLKKARQQPHFILPGIGSLLNGYWHKIIFLFLGKNVRIGKHFRLYGRLRIIGPGRIRIGDHCLFDSRLMGEVAFYTDSPKADIHIGHQVTMHGAKIQCYHNIRIGNLCSLADAYVTDSQGHLMSADRRAPSAGPAPSAPVLIDENVWISTRAVILEGVSIGRNTVVGACTLVQSHQALASDSFYAGVPARCLHQNLPGKQS